MTRPNAILLPVLLCLALPLAGCRDAGDSAMPSNEGPPPAASAAPTATLASGEADALTQVDLAGEQAAVDRKLIQNAELHLEVDNYEKARRALDAELGSLGGFVANAEVQHRDGDVSHAKLTLRIPSDKLHGFLGTAAGQGKVMHENLRTQDITDGYYDLQARLDNARKLETRLLALMTEKAHGMKELLELEREIARVREQIERHEGKLRLWDKQVAMSTVELSLFTKQVYTAAAPPTLSEKMGDTLGSSWGALVALGHGLLLLGTLLVPWLFPLALIALAVRAVWRRRKRPTVPFVAPNANATPTSP
ncbi:MAG: DUF4349 domain-containing protein [Polyangiaceae bacterium]